MTIYPRLDVPTVKRGFSRGSITGPTPNHHLFRAQLVSDHQSPFRTFTFIMPSLRVFFRNIRESIRERRRQRGLQRRRSVEIPPEDAPGAGGYQTHQWIDSSETSTVDSYFPPGVCSFCFEQIEDPAYPPRKPTKRCRQDGCRQDVRHHNVCTKCLAKWITSRVDSKPSKSVVCYGCEAPFDREEIVEFAPTDVVERYEVSLPRPFRVTKYNANTQQQMGLSAIKCCFGKTCSKFPLVSQPQLFSRTGVRRSEFSMPGFESVQSTGVLWLVRSIRLLLSSLCMA